MLFKLALRAGNEKDVDEVADTVGCCSLRCEHIKLHEKLDDKEYVLHLVTEQRLFLLYFPARVTFLQLHISAVLVKLCMLVFYIFYSFVRRFFLPVLESPKCIRLYYLLCSYVVEFDFPGKDSIRYYNKVPVEKRVFNNLKLFMENKDPGDDLFDRLDVSLIALSFMLSDTPVQRFIRHGYMIACITVSIILRIMYGRLRTRTVQVEVHFMGPNDCDVCSIV